MTLLKNAIAGAALALVAAFAPVAVAQGGPPPQNVLQLSATGSVETQQDLLSITMNVTRDGADAAAVQGQLKSILDAALTEAKKSVQPGQFEVRTGSFGVYPRYGTGGRINGWQGNAELVLEGRDFARITQVAGRLTTMTLGNVGFGLSREQRQRVESDAQAQAIERFKAKAGELARGFGFSGYTLREVSVASNDFNPGPRPRMAMAASAKSVNEEAVPVEAGKSTVSVTVTGSVQLR